MANGSAKERNGSLFTASSAVSCARFRGWRVGVITADPALALATALPFLPPGPWLPHGGLRVRLYRTPPLP